LSPPDGPGAQTSLRIGCCGFSYADWKGTFYPLDAAPADYLTLYAQAFPAVEVDSTFYGPPTEATVRQWRERTPEGFEFALKVPQVITHEKRLAGADAEFQEFLGTTSALGRKRGPLLLQFPRFSRADFEDGAEFLRALDAFLAKGDRSVRLAVEIRNREWFDDAFLDVLRDHGAAAALTDQIGGPPRPSEEQAVVTADFAYVRLLGQRRRIEAITKSWDKTVIDRTPELRSWADFLRGLSRAIPDLAIRVFTNNHLSGHAPAAARRLAAILGEGA
jgi:uncharacterized protein YecE (DUF72 family)